jgi:hypothetical protein
MDFLSQLHAAEQQFKRKEIKKQVEKGQTYKIRTRQYCGLSREKKWQDWLGETAPDLLDDLQNHLRNSSGCKQNRLKMEKIQEELLDRGLSKKLLLFLNDNYPNVLA